MIYQARTVNTEMFIAMYETEEPKFKKGNISTWKIRNDEYNRLLKQWQSSKREYKVRGEYKDAIKRIIADRFGCFDGRIGLVERELPKAIDCTFLKDRLKLEGFCQIECNCSCTGGNCNYRIKQWTLLPLEDKKENEAVDYWQRRCELAENCLNECPCDPDITPKQIEAWKQYHSFIKEYGQRDYQLFKNPNKQ